MMPSCVPGLFLCWHREIGLRYRDTMYSASFADYASGRRRLVPEAEIFFPQDLGGQLEFPWASVRDAALLNGAMQKPEDVSPTVPEMLTLIFDEEAGRVTPGAPAPDIVPAMPVRPDFHITQRLISEHGPTPHCKGCDRNDENNCFDPLCRG